MADRVLLGAFEGTYVFRASRPGYDVKNASLSSEKLSFDSRWPEIGNILSRGTFQISGNGPAQNVYFGTTYSSPPLVLVHMSGPSNDLSKWFPIDQAIWYDFNVGVYVFRDRFQVAKSDTNNLGPSQRTFRYVVMRNFYG